MYCSKCGNELKDDMVFCNKCGKPINNIEVRNSSKRPKRTHKIIIIIIVILLVLILFFYNIKKIYNKISFLDIFKIDNIIESEQEEKKYIYTVNISGDSNNVSISEIQYNDDGIPYVKYNVSQCPNGHNTKSAPWGNGIVTGEGTHTVYFNCGYQKIYTTNTCHAKKTFYITITKNEVK